MRMMLTCAWVAIAAAYELVGRAKRSHSYTVRAIVCLTVAYSARFEVPVENGTNESIGVPGGAAIKINLHPLVNPSVGSARGLVAKSSMGRPD